MKYSELEPNINDTITSALKSMFGPVHDIGSFLSELAGIYIPNQRIDRVSKFLIVLDKKLNFISENIVNELKQNPEFIELIELGIISAVNTASNKRRDYISELIINGISSEEIEIYESKYLLKLLEEINDIELIWLRYHLHQGVNSDKEFRTLHEKTISDIRVHTKSTMVEINKAAIQTSYKEHLVRLKLLNQIISFNREKGIPEYDNQGNAKISHYKITDLGKLILKQIGLS